MMETPLPAGLAWAPGGSEGVAIVVADEASGQPLRGHPYSAIFARRLRSALAATDGVGDLAPIDSAALVDEAAGWRGDRSDLAESLDAATAALHAYQAVLGGDVAAVRAYLQKGGDPDEFYQTAWGWDGVGPEWAWAKPNHGTTLLNYVCTMLDVVTDAVAVEMVRELLSAGADPRRDDGAELWFAPIHNAVANGGDAVVQAILQNDPRLVDATTGVGSTPLFEVCRCDDADARHRTVGILIGAGANVNFREPFHGETPLHAAARAGAQEVVGLLVAHGAAVTVHNDAGHAPLDVCRQELASQLDLAGSLPVADLERRVEALRETADLLEGLMAMEDAGA